MSYMLLCVLPKDIIEIIYKFKIKNIELKAYAFKYFTKFEVCNYGYIKSDVYPGVYDLDKLYKKHKNWIYIWSFNLYAWIFLSKRKTGTTTYFEPHFKTFDVLL